MIYKNSARNHYRSRNLRQHVEGLVRTYSAKAGIKSNVNVFFDKQGQKLADVRWKQGSPDPSIHINIKQLEENNALDPQLSDELTEYGVAHEIAHIQQVEEHGKEKCANTPAFLLEMDAEKRMVKLSGIKESEVDEVASKLADKYKEKHGIKDKLKPLPDASRQKINGKEVARVMGWESARGGLVVPSGIIREERQLPKNPKTVWIVQFAEDGQYIPKSDKYVTKEQLRNYYLV